MKVMQATEPKDITPSLWAKFEHGRELLLRSRALEVCVLPLRVRTTLMEEQIVYDEIQVEVRKRQQKEKENTES
jgi:hypothetical protein